MGKNYYKEFYSKEVDLDLENFYYASPSMSWFWHQRKKIILDCFQQLEKKKRLSILDIGSGKGRSLFEIHRKAKRLHEYYGTEIVKIILDYPRKYVKKKNWENFHFLNVDASKEGWGNQLEIHFDLIILSEVIEHLFPKDQKTVLEEIEKILSPGGLLVITCPNRSCLIKKGIRFFQKVPGIKNYLRKFGDFNGSKGHVGELSFSELERITKNFRKVKHGGLTFSYGSEIFDNNAFYFLLLIFLNSIFKLFFPFWCFDQYMILKKK